jgi:hypothetical protein
MSMPNYQSEIKRELHDSNAHRLDNQGKLYFKSIESMTIANNGHAKCDGAHEETTAPRTIGRATQKMSGGSEKSEISIEKNRRRQLENAGIGSLKK